MEKSLRSQLVAALITALGFIQKSKTYTDQYGDVYNFLSDIGKNVKDFDMGGVVNPDTDQDALYVHDFECQRSEDGEDNDNTEAMDHKSLQVRIIFQKCGKSRMSELREGIFDIGHAIKFCAVWPEGITSVKWVSDSINVHELNVKYGGTVYTLALNYSVPEFED